jgi:AraC-like DNA-binding protein
MAGIETAAEAGGPVPLPAGAAFRFSTDTFPERERMAAWREVFGRTVLHLDFVPRSGEAFQAKATILRAPRLRVLRASTSSARQGSSPSLLVNDDVSFVWVPSVRCGASQLGRNADLNPGDGVFLSHGDVGGLAFPDDCRYVALAMPKAALSPLVPDLGRLFGHSMPAANPAQRMLLRYLRLARADHIAADPALQHAFADHVCDLLALVLGATRDAAELARTRGVPAARFRAFQDDIRKSHGRPDFSVHTVAARHGISPRYVQRVFEERGTTFTQYLSEQRLASAHQALRGSTAAISTIAYDCGFSDVSHFNRLFRQRFGCTPSDVRNSAREA